MTIMGMVTYHPREVWFLSHPVDAELTSRDRWVGQKVLDDCVRSSMIAAKDGKTKIFV